MLTEAKWKGILFYDDEDAMARVHAQPIARKKELYWLGFLEGAVASGRIESGEPAAILAESKRFTEFFDDPDANDLTADICSGCFESADDMLASIRDIIEERRLRRGARYFTDVDELNLFMGFCAGIVCDGIVLESEVRAIRERMHASAALMAAPFTGLRTAVDRALHDGVVTAEESAEIQEWLARLVGDGYADTGIANIGNVANLHDPISDPGSIAFDQRRFVLTGPMRMGTRSFIVRQIEAAGGIYDSNVSRHTDYVIIASTASKTWLTTHFGTKINRAKELIDQGHGVRFVYEGAFETALQVRGVY